MNGIEVSVIVPCYNETKNIRVVYSAISNVFSGNSCFELIFIDDGSEDTTLDEIKLVVQKDANVKYIAFSRNFGHQQALKAGLDMAQGQAVIMMDGDLQHPPSLIPEIINKWKEGYDIVNTVREESKKIGFFKRKSANLFYWILNFLTDLNLKPGMADFRLLDKKVVDVVRSCNEYDIFIRGMVKWIGFNQTSIHYIPVKRHSGKTKYSLRKMISFAISGITSFSVRPLRVSVLLASVFILFSVIEIIYVLYIVLFTGQFVSGWASLAILISFLGAGTLLMLGIIGEYIGKMFLQSKGRPNYIIKETNCKQGS